jgi:tRNA pseudouridine55 synthase
MPKENIIQPHPKDGYMLVDKPLGWTSFDVVAKLRGTYKQYLRANFPDQQLPKRPKVGHTGTLDPDATGLMVVVFGLYTKKVETLTKLDKSYVTTITLGATSTTDDAVGDITPWSSSIAPEPSRETVEKAVKGTIGTYLQMPPQFSAIKVDGVRSYDAAREGKTVELKLRTVTVLDAQLFDYVYPLVTCGFSVGSGTYIRSLARDLGVKLDTGGYVSQLRRTTVGKFSIENAHTVEEVTVDTFQECLRILSISS